MKKTILAIILVSAMLLSLTSCGFLFSDSTPAGSGNDEANSSSTTVTVECPQTLKYGFKATDHVYSECKLENISYSVSDGFLGKSIKITYDVTKTYDADGDLGDNSVHFRWILYSEDGSIVKTDNVFILDDMIVNQKLTGETFTISLDTLESSYKLVFLDYII